MDKENRGSNSNKTLEARKQLHEWSWSSRFEKMQSTRLWVRPRSQPKYARAAEKDQGWKKQVVLWVILWVKLKAKNWVNISIRIFGPMASYPNLYKWETTLLSSWQKIRLCYLARGASGLRNQSPDRWGHQADSEDEVKSTYCIPKPTHTPPSRWELGAKLIIFKQDFGWFFSRANVQPSRIYIDTVSSEPPSKIAQLSIPPTKLHTDIQSFHCVCESLTLHKSQRQKLPKSQKETEETETTRGTGGKFKYIFNVIAISRKKDIPFIK